MRGGKRVGAGRPKSPSPLKMRSMRLSEEEYQKVKDYIKKLRSENNDN